MVVRLFNNLGKGKKVLLNNGRILLDERERDYYGMVNKKIKKICYLMN